MMSKGHNNLKMNGIKMSDFGTNLDSNGCVMDQEELDRLREKRAKNGLCVMCGRKCFKKSLSGRRLLPISKEGEVDNGVCLRCNISPLQTTTTQHDEIPRDTQEAGRDYDLELAIKLSLTDF